MDKVILALTVCLFLAGETVSFAKHAEHGVIDLSNEPLRADSPIELSGSWQFFWNRLSAPEDLDGGKAAYINVPGSWHRQGDYSALGYATYRLKIKLPATQSGMSIYFPVINSSSKFFVNGKFLLETGTVATNRDAVVPQLTSTLIHLPNNVAEIELVIQVANFNYFSGGIAGTPLLEKTSSAIKRLNRTNGVENFFAGSLIAMFIYQTILYFMFRRGKPYLWLALICLGVALRALIVHGGSFLLPDLFRGIHWEIWKKIEFGAVYGIVALFPLYVYDLFREEAPRWPLYFFVTIAIAMTGCVIVTPQYIYGALLEVAHVTLLLSFIYAIYSISKAWGSGSTDARIILFGVIASFPFIMLEIMKNSRLFPVNIEFMYLVEMGVLVFLLFQVYLLANHYAKSYNNLEALNQNLEKIVHERSSELIKANEVKDRLLSIVSHDIKSPLNSLRGILQIYNQGSITKEEFSHFTKHIENDLQKTSLLVDNILYWTSSQLRGINVTIESFELRPLIDENVHLFQTIAKAKNVTLLREVAEDLVVSSDKNIINLVLRNLISNAIKFSYERGKISITAKKENGQISLSVSDDGIGMDDEKLQTLLAPELVVSSSGTKNERGTGLGLSLCREYLEKTGGRLEVRSVEGKGSRFTIFFPAKTT